ncbi:hypothetical protein KAR91_32400 [Candidatus Pacearchaeota archaeon]|nr:hypothetical protein [Candidatus Pacearchaeota archaeon]
MPHQSESEQTTTLRATQKQVQNLQAELTKYQERLFVIGELAVSSFDDSIVGIVDQTLAGFKLDKVRYDEVLIECMK